MLTKKESKEAIKKITRKKTKMREGLKIAVKNYSKKKPKILTTERMRKKLGIKYGRGAWEVLMTLAEIGFLKRDSIPSSNAYAYRLRSKQLLKYAKKKLKETEGLKPIEMLELE